MTKRGITTPQIMFMQRAGRRLALHRIAHQMSLEQLGEVAGQHRNTILRWEKGENCIDLWSLVLIAHAFDVTPARLMEMLMDPRLPIRQGVNSERDPRLTKYEARILRKEPNEAARTDSNFAV